jgi:Flp pilus assembly protein TadD
MSFCRSGRLSCLALLLGLGVGVSGQAQEAAGTWAVVVGVSKFKSLKADEQLQYADKDAEAFAKFISSPRGRGVKQENITLMLNGDATAAAIKKRLGTTLPRSAKPNDVVYIFLATHGMVEKDAAKAAYILGTDADPEDLYSTAIPMKDLDDIVSSRLEKAGRIVLLADACHSGTMGGGIHASLQAAAGKRKELIGLMASRGLESSMEGPQFCGGHGAFTCFLLRGLDGAADADKDKTVTVSELIDYLTENIRKATDNKQHLQNFGSFDNEVPLSCVDKPGVELGLPKGSLMSRPEFLVASLRPLLPHSPDLRQDFERALKEGKLLTPTGQSAWDLYQQLSKSAPAAEQEDARDSLAIALEDKGQEVLLAYLKGDARPLSPEQYSFGAQLFERASELSPEFPKLKAKARFCEGRAAVARNQFAPAEAALREAIQLDKDGAYSYNALGIAYMNQRRYNDAITNFKAAIERAPKWAYPNYNMAYAYEFMGDLSGAERAYKAALERADYAYLHYSLGSLYLKMRDRQGDAEKELRRAIELKPDDGVPYNLLGGMLQNRGDLGAAEAQLRLAVKVNPENVDFRRNLAKILLDRGNKQEAEKVLREALQMDPRYADAHRALGLLLMERGAMEEAETEFMVLLQLNPGDPSVFILLGDLHTAQKRNDDAANDYRQAQQLTTDPALLREIARKLKKVTK